MALNLSRPVHQLDPLSPDLHEDGVKLREHGPIVPVELPGGVPMWGVTGDEAGRNLLKDTDRFTKRPEYWRALQEGEIPQDWPMLSITAPSGHSVVNTDGPEHRKLRRPLAQALTARRVEALTPLVTSLVERLLAEMEQARDEAEDGIIDFRARLAWPLPMGVIGYLLGVDESDHAELGRLYSALFDDTTGEGRSAELALHSWLDAHVARLEREPGDDLVSSMLALPEEDRLPRQDLVVTLYVVLAAGHETTTHLLLNAVRALSARPEQLKLLLSGEVPWENAVEETMRWDSPTANFFTRFATEDVDGGDIHPAAAGVKIAKGDPVFVSYISMGRDPERFGPTAGEFDIQREGAAHTGFGYGAHFCIGAPLARLEAGVALKALFTRWPDLEVVGDVPRAPTVAVNSHTHLNVRLK